MDGDKLAWGGNIPSQSYTAGSTITAGDFVKIAADDGKVDTVAADGEVILGRALNGAVVNGVVQVAKAYPGAQFTVFLTSQTTPDPTGITLVGKNYAIAGTTGAQTVNLNDTTNCAFKLIETKYDYGIKGYVAIVEVMRTVSQTEIIVA